MQTCGPAGSRTLKCERLTGDLLVVGGGLAGVCCAITAARAGIQVVLVQDRPVLGGNASSEVRLWVLGATSHMGNNNRWAREGGAIDELLTENLYRNREGNPVLVDALVLDMVTREPNITLLLNAAVDEVIKHDPETIAGVRAFCSQNSTRYEITAPLVCDASGDGIVGFLAGAAFRMGAEAEGEFGEKLAPSEEYGELLGHSLYFYTRDTGRPVRFVPPAFAIDDITRIPRYRTFNARQHGCELWWIEFGGRLDTVHDTETIKWELWKVVYGVWNYIKNSGEFPDAETRTLEWVGMIPGKRESRRFEGDYMLTQGDVIEQRPHEDAVSFGGWALDLHPADGVFSEKPGCNQWHSKGVYTIPYRCMYSRNIRNLFLAGRIISASHVAFGSTRVMGTCAHGAQAVGMAAAICRREKLLPREVFTKGHVPRLQRELLRIGQHIPGVRREDPTDLATRATITASSELTLSALPPADRWLTLDRAWAMLVPLGAGRVPRMTVEVRASRATQLTTELRICSRLGSYTPDTVLAAAQHVIRGPKDGRGDSGETLILDFDRDLPSPQYAFVCLMDNPGVSVRLSEQRLTGVLSVRRGGNDRVAESDAQTGVEDLGVESFEFWLPQRRPGGHNMAMRFDPPLTGFGADQLINGLDRPGVSPHAWVAACDDAEPWVELTWDRPQNIGCVELVFDNDLDHPMESVLMGHPEDAVPFCVPRLRLVADDSRVLHTCEHNHQGRRTIDLPAGPAIRRLRLELSRRTPTAPASLFAVRCYPASTTRGG